MACHTGDRLKKKTVPLSDFLGLVQIKLNAEGRKNVRVLKSRSMSGRIKDRPDTNLISLILCTLAGPGTIHNISI